MAEGLDSKPFRLSGFYKQLIQVHMIIMSSFGLKRAYACYMHLLHALATHNSIPNERI